MLSLIYLTNIVAGMANYTARLVRRHLKSLRNPRGISVDERKTVANKTFCTAAFKSASNLVVVSPFTLHHFVALRQKSRKLHSPHEHAWSDTVRAK